MTLKIVKFLFIAYQTVTRTRYSTCRYTPTCSQYAVDAIEKYGSIKGLFLTASRVMSCQPFSKKSFYDPA